MIPVVVVLWENENFGGRKRLLIEDVPDLHLLGFDNLTSAIGVHPGPDFDAWKRAHGGIPPKVVCYVDEDYRGDGLVLDEGGMNKLSIFNDTISSVRINPPFLQEGRDATLVDLTD